APRGERIRPPRIRRRDFSAPPARPMNAHGSLCEAPMKYVSARLVTLAVVLLGASAAQAACPVKLPDGCQKVTASSKLPDQITSCFYVEGATGSPHSYELINVLKGGALYFVEKAGETTDFRVSAMLIEQGGLVQAGGPDCPYGKDGGKLKIGL